MQQAAVLFPAAAKANRNVFYDQTTGRAKSLDEVYTFFDGKFGGAQATTPAAISAPKEQEYPASSTDLNYVKFIQGNTRGLNSFGGYHNLFTNPVEIMLMAQMDLPISRKNPEFQLFSTYTALK